MKYLPVSILLATSLAFTGCASLPHKPRTFDQLGQFSSYPLNSQSFRIGLALLHKHSKAEFSPSHSNLSDNLGVRST